MALYTDSQGCQGCQGLCVRHVCHRHRRPTSRLSRANWLRFPSPSLNIYAPARPLQTESTYYQTINLPVMSGLLNKLTDQFSNQNKQQGSSSSGGLLHKVTDAVTGQKHPQDYQNQPNPQGSGYGYGAGPGRGAYQQSGYAGILSLTSIASPDNSELTVSSRPSGRIFGSIWQLRRTARLYR